MVKVDTLNEVRERHLLEAAELRLEHMGKWFDTRRGMLMAVKHDKPDSAVFLMRDWAEFTLKHAAKANQLLTAQAQEIAELYAQDRTEDSE